MRKALEPGRKSFEGTSRTLTNLVNKLPLIGEKTENKEEDDKFQLDEIIDINQDLDFFRQNQVKLLKPKELYSSKKTFSFQTGLFRSYKEETVSCLEDESISIDLLNSESRRKLIENNYKLIHNGLIVIGIKGLGRKELGTKVLLTIYDDRWLDMKKMNNSND